VFKHILFPTDGTELSRKAQAAALELAKSLGARVTAIHSIEPYTPQVTDLTFVYADPIPPEEYLAAARQASAAIYFGLAVVLSTLMALAGRALPALPPR